MDIEDFVDNFAILLKEVGLTKGDPLAPSVIKYLLLGEYGRNGDLVDTLRARLPKPLEETVMTAADYIRQNALNEGINQGINQGISQGINLGKREAMLNMARTLLALGEPVEKIALVTHLSQQEIEAVIQKEESCA